jgi:hypothetical protein
VQSELRSAPAEPGSGELGSMHGACRREYDGHGLLRTAEATGDAACSAASVRSSVSTRCTPLPEGACPASKLRACWRRWRSTRTHAAEDLQAAGGPSGCRRPALAGEPRAPPPGLLSMWDASSDPTLSSESHTNTQATHGRRLRFLIHKRAQKSRRREKGRICGVSHVPFSKKLIRHSLGNGDDGLY